MEQLSPAYIGALASQLAALSAFLGGFAATFLATLLTLGHQSRLMTVTIGLAVTSAVGFIVTVVAATMLIAISHPAAPPFMAALATSWPRTIMSVGFTAGALSLLGSLGCSGWTRSRSIGWTTTIAAIVGATLIVSMTCRFGRVHKRPFLLAFRLSKSGHSFMLGLGERRPDTGTVDLMLA